MAIVAEWIKIDSEHVLESMEVARKKLSSGENEAVLDFSSVRRLDAAALRRLNELSEIASDKSARIALRGVTVDVYRVLKAAKIAANFFFLN